jgi:hypothetical protein
MGETSVFALLWGKVWAGFTAILPAAIGSALSIKFNRHTSGILSAFEKIGIFISGLVVGYTLGSGLSEWWTLDQAGWASFSIKMLIGLFGMGILAELFVQIPLWVKALRIKLLGE